MPFPKIRHRWRIPLILVIVILVVIQYGAFNIGDYKNSGSGLDLTTDSVHDEHSPLGSAAPIDEEDDSSLPHTTLQGVRRFRSNLPRIQRVSSNESEHVRSVRVYRQQAVKDAFKHTWEGYKKYAWGHDEVKPNTNGTVDNFGGWGATLVDSLSTMLIMELENEFNETIETIAGIDYNRTLYGGSISVFETIIRHLGGLLSAYELSGNPVLLTKAEELGHVLMPAFDTPYDLPHHNWFLTRQVQNSRDNFSLIAEVGTVQLEFMALSHHTGDPQYARKAKRIMNYVESMGIKEGLHIPGLYPTSMNVGSGTFTNFQVSFGGAGDSAFEYFLKQYLLVDGTVPQYKRMYIESMEGMRRYMLRQLPGSELLYLGPFETMSRTPVYHMDHLTCFVPGMLAMGAQVFDRPEDLMIARGLLETCVYMYQSSATGLCPERWTYYELTTETFNGRTYNKTKQQIRKDQYLIFHPQAREEELAEHERLMAAKENMYGDPPPPLEEDKINVLHPNRPQRPIYRGGGGDVMYLLRPETVESIFILYRITGDPKYQEYGWDIFQAIEKYCKTSTAYTSIRTVEFVPSEDEDIESNQMDSMESFFMAETLKYLYLLFSDDDVISLDKFVFNTEAHPLMRRPWSSASAASIDFVDPIEPPKQNVTDSSQEQVSLAAKDEK